MRRDSELRASSQGRQRAYRPRIVSVLPTTQHHGRLHLCRARLCVPSGCQAEIWCSNRLGAAPGSKGALVFRVRCRVRQYRPPLYHRY